MTRRPKTTAFWMGRLPHWEVEEGRYFITLHLAGAIPVSGRNRIRGMAGTLQKIGRRDSPDWLRLQRAIFAEMENWLDRTATNAVLERRDLAEMVVESIEHRCDRGDWRMFEYVVMPTHLHMFCELGGRGLKTTMEDFKRWTGHRASQILRMDGEHFWQREWFDHWSRSDEEDDRTVKYICRNPVKAQLVQQHLDWPYASWRSRCRLPG